MGIARLVDGLAGMPNPAPVVRDHRSLRHLRPSALLVREVAQSLARLVPQHCADAREGGDLLGREHGQLRFSRRPRTDPLRSTHSAAARVRTAWPDTAIRKSIRRSPESDRSRRRRAACSASSRRCREAWRKDHRLPHLRQLHRCPTAVHVPLFAYDEPFLAGRRADEHLGFERLQVSLRYGPSFAGHIPPDRQRRRPRSFFGRGVQPWTSASSREL